MGWMETPILNYQGQASYAKPHYGSQSPIRQPSLTPGLNVPGVNSFCTSTNHCDPNYVNGSQSYCNLPGRNCYWHSPVTFVSNCSTMCATGVYTYALGAVDPGVTNPHPPDCNSTRDFLTSSGSSETSTA